MNWRAKEARLIDCGLYRYFCPYCGTRTVAALDLANLQFEVFTGPLTNNQAIITLEPGQPSAATSPIEFNFPDPVPTDADRAIATIHHAVDPDLLGEMADRSLGRLDALTNSYDPAQAASARQNLCQVTENGFKKTLKLAKSGDSNAGTLLAMMVGWLNKSDAKHEPDRLRKLNKAFADTLNQRRLASPITELVWGILFQAGRIRRRRAKMIKAGVPKDRQEYSMVASATAKNFTPEVFSLADLTPANAREWMDKIVWPCFLKQSKPDLSTHPELADHGGARRKVAAKPQRTWLKIDFLKSVVAIAERPSGEARGYQNPIY
jgi:hypothetical protein